MTRRVTDPRSLARERRASRRLTKEDRHFTALTGVRPLRAKRARLPTPQRRRSSSITWTADNRVAARSHPGNTAGPVLPHRPSKTPPVLRNHREGQVTMLYVTTRSGKTTPVGPIVTTSEAQRLHSGNDRRSGPAPRRRRPGGACDRRGARSRTCSARRLHARRRLADRPAAPRRGAAARDERRRSPLVALAGYRAPRRSCPPVPGRQVRRAAHDPAIRRDELGGARPVQARTVDGSDDVHGCPWDGEVMAAGRPHGPNDPSLMSSLETAVRQVRRPGPVELAWNWRWELGILAGPGRVLRLITGAFGLIGLAVAAGAGLAAGAAAAAAGRQPASGSSPGPGASSRRTGSGRAA